MNSVGIVCVEGTVYVAPSVTTSPRPTLITPVAPVSLDVTVCVVRVVTCVFDTSTRNP